MTSTQTLQIARFVIENNPEKSGPLLVLLDVFLNARGDPMAEVVVRDVKRFLWSNTENSDAAMEKFICEAVTDSSHLAA
jgi:hypothetical protein